MTKRIKTEKIRWEKLKLEQCKSDPGKMWSNVKGLLNWTSVLSPTKLFYNGVIETSPGKLASIMNEFYVDKVITIRENLPSSNKDPLEKLRHLRRNKMSVFSLQTVHPDVISKIIGGLKYSKATGFDFIDSYVLKLVKIEITPALTHIINLSIQTSTFPTLWKHAKVIPLLKPGSEDQLMPKSYRPVALLSVLSKVLERAIFMQTVQYMNEQNLMHPYHHGFRTDHSTTTAMLQMYDLWVGAANRGELAGVAMIDQSAAFDCVDHPLLIEKLKLYGWDDMSLEWTKNYLSSRSQSCSVESFVSEPLPVSFGVPQGSILGPLYFCIFTNDFPECVHQSDCPHKFQENDGGSMFNLQCQKCGTVTVYADDSTYTITDTDPIRLSRKLSQKFDVMAEYLTANKLKVNNDKTHLMLMCTDQRRRKQTSTLKVRIGITEIEVS